MFLTEKKSRELQLVCDLFFHACRCFTNICKIPIRPGNRVGERGNTAEELLGPVPGLICCQLCHVTGVTSGLLRASLSLSSKWDALYFSIDVVFQAALEVILNGSWWTQMYSKQKQTNKQELSHSLILTICPIQEWQRFCTYSWRSVLG